MILVHFNKLKKIMEIRGWDEEVDKIEISRAGFKELLAGYVESKSQHFDSSWYLKNYPDVAKSVQAKIIRAPKEHYTQIGYIEGRLPGLKGVDFEEYLNKYPDVLNSISHLGKKKRKEAAIQHIVNYGYKEGRQIGS